MLGATFGAALGTSGRRLAILSGAGLAVVLALLVVGILASPPAGSSEECWECGEYFGREFQPIVFFLALWNVLAWALGLFLGAAGRRVSTGRREARSGA